jgi:hypothetical protein
VLCAVTLGLGAPLCRAAEPASVSAAPVLEGLFGSPRASTRTVDTQLTPALDGLTGPREPRTADDSAKTVEAFAARIWYAGALLLTADRVVRSMDSILESAQIEGNEDQRFGLDLSSNGVGMVLRFERTF